MYKNELALFEQRAEGGGVMAGHYHVVVADGSGEEIAGVGGIVELDHLLGAAQVGFPFAAQQLTFGQEIA